jgi:hypothetical protein
MESDEGVEEAREAYLILEAAVASGFLVDALDGVGESALAINGREGEIPIGLLEGLQLDESDSLLDLIGWLLAEVGVLLIGLELSGPDLLRLQREVLLPQLVILDGSRHSLLLGSEVGVAGALAVAGLHFVGGVGVVGIMRNDFVFEFGRSLKIIRNLLVVADALSLEEFLPILVNRMKNFATFDLRAHLQTHRGLLDSATSVLEIVVVDGVAVLLLLRFSRPPSGLQHPPLLPFDFSDLFLNSLLCRRTT